MSVAPDSTCCRSMYFAVLSAHAGCFAARRYLLPCCFGAFSVSKTFTAISPWRGLAAGLLGTDAGGRRLSKKAECSTDFSF